MIGLHLLPEKMFIEKKNFIVKTKHFLPRLKSKTFKSERLRLINFDYEM